MPSRKIAPRMVPQKQLKSLLSSAGNPDYTIPPPPPADRFLMNTQVSSEKLNRKRHCSEIENDENVEQGEYKLPKVLYDPKRYKLGHTYEGYEQDIARIGRDRPSHIYMRKKQQFHDQVAAYFASIAQKPTDQSGEMAGHTAIADKPSDGYMKKGEEFHKRVSRYHASIAEEHTNLLKMPFSQRPKESRFPDRLLRSRERFHEEVAAYHRSIVQQDTNQFRGIADNTPIANRPSDGYMKKGEDFHKRVSSYHASIAEEHTNLLKEPAGHRPRDSKPNDSYLRRKERFHKEVAAYHRSVVQQDTNQFREIADHTPIAEDDHSKRQDRIQDLSREKTLEKDDSADESSTSSSDESDEDKLHESKGYCRSREAALKRPEITNESSTGLSSRSTRVAEPGKNYLDDTRSVTPKATTSSAPGPGTSMAQVSTLGKRRNSETSNEDITVEDPLSKRPKLVHAGSAKDGPQSTKKNRTGPIRQRKGVKSVKQDMLVDIPLKWRVQLCEDENGVEYHRIKLYDHLVPMSLPGGRVAELHVDFGMGKPADSVSDDATAWKESKVDEDDDKPEVDPSAPHTSSSYRDDGAAIDIVNLLNDIQHPMNPRSEEERAKESQRIFEQWWPPKIFGSKFNDARIDAQDTSPHIPPVTDRPAEVVDEELEELFGDLAEPLEDSMEALKGSKRLSDEYQTKSGAKSGT